MSFNAREVLEYHVVSGKLISADVVKLDSATRTEGSPMTIDTSNSVKVNDATVITPDVEADNDVIHIIDPVLIPQ